MRKNPVAVPLIKVLAPALLALLTCVGSGHAATTVLKRKPERIIKAELLSSQGEMSDKTPAELQGMLRGYQTLIKNETNAEKRAKLKISEAGTNLAVARLYRVGHKGTKPNKRLEREASLRVIRGLEGLSGDVGLSAAQRAKAAFFTGLAELNLGKEDETARQFQKVLELEPKSPGAPSLALFLAEWHFEKGRFQMSLDTMKEHYDRFNESQKALSLYKTAWCHVNMNNIPAAEANLLALADKDTPFSVDAMKDLAYVMTLRRSEEDVIKYAEEHFRSKPQVEAAFLSQVYVFFQSQTSTKKKSALLNHLMKSEKDPVKRIRLMISTLKTAQREQASLGAFNEFIMIRDEVESLRGKMSGDAWDNVMSDLEIEIFALARAYLATWNKKSGNPQNISVEDLGANLTEILSFHLTAYPQSRDREGTYLNLVKVCETQKNTKCAAEAADRILNDPKSSASLKKAAQMTRLRALDVMAADNPSARPKLIYALENFTEGRAWEEDTLTAAKRLVGLYLEEKKPGEALALMEKIHEREKSTESLYRLQSARFQAERYDLVTSAPFKKGNDKWSRETESLIREAHLKLAQKNIAGNNFDEYARNLSEFIRSNPDPEKADIARKDLINQLLDRKMYDRAAKEMALVPASRRMAKLSSETLRLAHAAVAAADFGEAAKWSASWTQASAPAQAGLELVNAGTRGLAGREIFVRDAKNREYLYGIMALSKPQLVIAAFAQRPPAGEVEKKILLLALKVAQRTLEPKLDAKQRVSLKGLYSEPTGSDSVTPAEKDLARIQFPGPKTKRAQFDQMAQKAAEAVRASRPKVSRDLEGRIPSRQMKLLVLARESEDKTAKMLLAAPVPEGLNKAQLAEYKKGIADLAAEFSRQADEYEKIRTALERTENRRNVAALPFPTETQWPAPKGEVGELVHDLVAKKQYAGALMMLDQRKADGAIDTDVYYQARAKVLFSMPTNPAVSAYFAAELGELGQKKLLGRWEDLVAKEKR